MDSGFNDILSAAVTPTVLISAVGLILLCSINRYNQAIRRTRQLIGERRGSPGKRKENLALQINVLVKRCKILRLSVAFLVISTVLSSFIVLESVIAVLTDLVRILLLFGSCLSIVCSNLFLLIDITLSLKALTIELEYSENEDLMENKEPLINSNFD